MFEIPQEAMIEFMASAIPDEQLEFTNEDEKLLDKMFTEAYAEKDLTDAKGVDIAWAAIGMKEYGLDYQTALEQLQKGTIVEHCFKIFVDRGDFDKFVMSRFDKKNRMYESTDDATFGYKIDLDGIRSLMSPLIHKIGIEKLGDVPLVMELLTVTTPVEGEDRDEVMFGVLAIKHFGMSKEEAIIHINSSTMVQTVFELYIKSPEFKEMMIDRTFDKIMAKRKAKKDLGEPDGCDHNCATCTLHDEAHDKDLYPFNGPDGSIAGRLTKGQMVEFMKERVEETDEAVFEKLMRQLMKDADHDAVKKNGDHRDLTWAGLGIQMFGIEYETVLIHMNAGTIIQYCFQCFVELHGLDGITTGPRKGEPIH